MCNDFGNHVPYTAYLEAFSQIKLPLITSGAIPNLEPRDDIWPTEIAPVVRRHVAGVELAQLRWGFASGRPKAPPVINFRSEGRRFPNGRCLVPASHFSSSPGRSRRNASGASPGPARIGSASPGSGGPPRTTRPKRSRS